MKRTASLLLSVLSLTVPSFAAAQTLPQAVRERIIKATVMLLPATEDGKLDGSRGSGTIISPEGFILTNYHVVGDNEARRLAPWVQVRTVRFVDEEPQPTYWGKVIAGDPFLDLAVVQIVEDKDEKPVGKLNLPFMQIGDSNRLTIGDPIYVFGFQGTGGMTLSYSAGSVAGFTGEDLSSGGRQWIKHDAQTGPGNSGGGAYNTDGDLIGVHSAGIAGQNNSRTSFMRPLSVAWGLITPNVPKFAVRSGTSTASTATNTGGAQAQTRGTTAGTGPAPTPRSDATGTLSWPLRGQSGQTWTMQYPEVGRISVTLTGTNAEGTPTGTATLPNGAKWSALFFAGTSSAAAKLAVSDGKAALFCAVDRAGLSGLNARGTALYIEDLNRSNGGDEVGDCTLQLQSGPGTTGSTTGTSGSLGSLLGQGGTTPSSAGLAWPLKGAVGQTWNVQLPQLGRLTVKLDGTTSTGNPKGTATLPDGTKWTAVLSYDTKADDTAMMVSDGDSLIYCLVTRSGLSGTTARGTAYYLKDLDSEDDPDKLGDCSFQLQGAAGAGTSGTGTAGTGTSTPTRLAWPLKPQVGQAWQVQIPELGLVTVSLTGRDDQGDPKGTATLPDGTKWTAYFYHEAAKNTTWLDILDGRGSMVYCAFTAQGLSGTGARGNAYYVKDVNAKEEPAKIGECSAQLK